MTSQQKGYITKILNEEKDVQRASERVCNFLDQVLIHSLYEIDRIGELLHAFDLEITPRRKKTAG